MDYLEQIFALTLAGTSKQILRPQKNVRGQLHDTMHRVDMLETRVAQIEKSLANSGSLILALINVKFGFGLFRTDFLFLHTGTSKQILRTQMKARG